MLLQHPAVGRPVSTLPPLHFDDGWWDLDKPTDWVTSLDPEPPPRGKRRSQMTGDEPVTVGTGFLTQRHDEVLALALAALELHAADGLSLLAWLHGRTVPRETRDDPIYPATLVQTDEGRRETMPVLIRTGDEHHPYLPLGVEHDEYAGELRVSVLPMELFTTRGKGAPLSIRLALGALLDVPRNRRDGQSIVLPKRPWRDVVAEMYPALADGRNSYKPGTSWPGVKRALEEIAADSRWLLPIPTGTGGWVGRRILYPLEVPLTGHRSEWIRWRVDLPQGAQRGPIADRTAWFRAAAISTARFALATGLSVLWDTPGKTRVRVSQRGPWVQSTDMDRYRVLSASSAGVAVLAARLAGSLQPP